MSGTSRSAAIPRRLAAILGVLVVCGERGLSRDRLLYLLWSDADPDRGRHALTQSLYALRRLLGVDDAIAGTAQLVLNSQRVSTDIGELERAMAAGDASRVLECYRGPLLDGFSVAGAPELERWIEEQRAQWTQRLAAFLDAHARSLQASGAHAEAVVILRRRAALDPLDATSAIALMRAFALAGDAPAASQHARVYGELVRQELELEPDPRVEAAAAELLAEARSRPVVVARTADANSPGSIANVGMAWRERASRLRGRLSGAGQNAAHWLRRRSRGWWSVARRAAITSVALVVALLAFAEFGRTRRQAAPVPRATAILPFRATSLSGDLAFLPGGIVDLLSVSMSERDSLPVLDPELVHRWWDAAFTGRPAPASDSVLAQASSLGARRLVTGTLVGNARQVMIRATLLDARSRRQLAAATVHGSLDSLPRLVDRVATLLVATAAGAGEAVSLAPDVDARALRAFLQGRAAYQRADFRAAQGAFASALALDSSLAASSLGLALASDWLEDVPARASALDAARRWRTKLPVVEQQQLVALRGPRYPNPSTGEEHFAAWERVARTGDRPELWADLGRRLIVDGRLAGLRDANARAQSAFARALALDSANVGARLALVTLAVSRPGDDDAAAPDENPSGDLAPWVRWRRAVRARDAEALQQAREGFESASDDALRRIAMTALAAGEQIADGERAVQARGMRAQSANARIDAVLAEHAYALNAGSPARAFQATRRLGDVVSNGAHLRLRVLDALYGDGDSAAALDAVDRLTERVRRVGRMSGDERASTLADLCVIEQWRVWHEDYSTTDATIRALAGDGEALAEEPVAAGRVACADVLDALSTGLQGATGAAEALVRAEQLVMSGPAAGDLRQYATLALARVREKRGEFGRAFALVQRRSPSRGWPRYLSEYLRTEARLAERLQDTEGAARALRHYLALRVAPDSSGRADRDEALAHLQRLEGRL